MAFISSGVENVIQWLSAYQRPNGAGCCPNNTFKDVNTHVSKTESLHDWFCRCSDIAGNVYNLCIEDNIAVVGVTKWKNNSMSYLNMQVIATEEGTIEDFYLNESAAKCHYFRLDVDFSSIGPLFKETLPHIHTHPDGSPRYHFVPKHERTLIPEFLEFIYLNYAYDKWVKWVSEVCSMKNVFGADDGILDTINYQNNPIVYSHYRFQLGGQRINFLSRVAPYGTDYSGRTNKLAHHILARTENLPECGPAQLMLQNNFFVTEWDGTTNLISSQKQLPNARTENFKAVTWEATTGDAGWAGVLAQHYIDSPSQPVFIIYEPGTVILPLLAEVLSLLSPEKRWDATFNTYATSLPQGSDCWCRCCLPSSPILNEARKTRNALIIN